MADFTEFLQKILQLEDNEIIPIQAAQQADALKDLDSTMFATSDSSMFQTTYDLQTASSFQAPMQASTDLSVYLESLSSSNERVKVRKRRNVPLSPGVPMPLLKEAFINPVPQIPQFDNFDTISITHQSEKPIQEVLDEAKPGSTISFRAGVYKGSLTIDKDIVLISNGDVIIQDGVEVKGGRVVIENFSFSKGSLKATSGFLHISKTRFTTTFYAQGDSVVCARNCGFRQNDGYSIIVDDKATLTMVECTVTDRGITVRNGNFAFIKGKIQAIIRSALDIHGGVSHFDSSSIGDCTSHCFACSGCCQVTISNCRVFDSENGDLVESKNGALVKIKGGEFTGRCKVVLHSLIGGSISADDLSFKKPVVATHRGMLKLFKCMPFSIFVADARLFMNNCELIAAPKSGIVAISNSYLDISNSNFKQCTANGIEMATEATGTFKNCQFINNQNAGASISATSAIFSDCLFVGNTLCGAQINGESSHPVFKNCLFSDNYQYGTTVLPNSEPEFTDCTFRQNEKCGSIVIKGLPIYSGCVFISNKCIGLEINSGSQAKLNQCKFDSNMNYGCQISGQNTVVSMNECNFSKHEKSSAVLVYSKAVASFSQSIFSGNDCYHLEVREEARCRVEKSVLSNSIQGIGVFVHTEGVLEIENSSLNNELKTAVYVGIRGHAVVNACEITDCKHAGIIVDTQSSAAIMNNTIRSNGSSGIQVEGGDVKIQNNNIGNHADFGIYSTSLGQILQEGNTFEDNGRGDTQIG